MPFHIKDMFVFGLILRLCILVFRWYETKKHWIQTDREKNKTCQASTFVWARKNILFIEKVSPFSVYFSNTPDLICLVMISWDRERYSPFQIIYSEKDEMCMACDISYCFARDEWYKNKRCLKIKKARAGKEKTKTYVIA